MMRVNRVLLPQSHPTKTSVRFRRKDQSHTQKKSHTTLKKPACKNISRPTQVAPTCSPRRLPAGARWFNRFYHRLKKVNVTAHKLSCTSYNLATPSHRSPINSA